LDLKGVGEVASKGRKHFYVKQSTAYLEQLSDYQLVKKHPVTYLPFLTIYMEMNPS
jgi:hypothetical protein